MKITCESCDKTIPSTNLDLATLKATCPDCGKTYHINSHAEPPKAARKERNTKGIYIKSKKRHVPKNITYDKDTYGCTIKYKWFSIGAVILVFITIGFNIPLYMFIRDWLAGDLTNKTTYTLSSFAYILGIAMMYLTLITCFNKRVFILNREKLVIKHSPFPAGFNFTIPIADIEHLYTSQKEYFDSDDHQKRIPTSVTYRIHLQKTNGKSIVITRHIPKIEQAHFIIETLRDHLDQLRKNTTKKAQLQAELQKNTR